MNRLPTGLLTLAFLLASLPFAFADAEGATAPAVRFGMDAPGVAAQAQAGVKPDYATMWIGPWTLKSGWGGPDATLSNLRSAGVTPAIHFYYWGDDISPSCVENGCWSSLHGAHKDRAGWRALGDQLAAHLHQRLQGGPALVFLESEFNKRGISTYEPFDGYLADMAYRLRAAYPNAQVVLGFGNWQSGDWHVFDRAAAASQFVGLQAMRGSTKDSSTAYSSAYDATLAGVRTLASLFHKPIVLTDVALSSYPEPGYLTMQRDSLQRFFAGLPALRDAGVRALIYRSWADAPGMSTANHYGEAERHWGVAYSGGSHKAAARVWIDGVKAVRAGTAPAPSAPSSPTTTGSAGFTAQFAPASGANEWWVDVRVTSSSAPVKVEVKAGSAAWAGLAPTDWGTWAKSFNVPKGTAIAFRAYDGAGNVATSPTTSWLGAPSSSTSSSTATSTSTSASSGFAASFTPKAVGNDWWVETAVSSSSAIAKVEVKRGTSAWAVLPRTSWGTWADDLHAPNGTPVTFRATSSAGATALSPTYTWT